MSVMIEESGMKFGEYEESQIFHIEKSKQYKALNHGLQTSGAATCEFVLLKDGILCFVEAKSSCPRTIHEDSTEESKEKYEDFVQQITRKMTDSIELYGTIILKRHEQSGISDEIRAAGLAGNKIRPILVINTQGAGWLPEPELQDKLREKLDFVRNMWNTRPILVINDVKAREKKLIF